MSTFGNVLLDLWLPVSEMPDLGPGVSATAIKQATSHKKLNEKKTHIAAYCMHWQPEGSIKPKLRHCMADISRSDPSVEVAASTTSVDAAVDALVAASESAADIAWIGAIAWIRLELWEATALEPRGHQQRAVFHLSDLSPDVIGMSE